jgi:hypothetical protein
MAHIERTETRYKHLHGLSNADLGKVIDEWLVCKRIVSVRFYKNRARVGVHIFYEDLDD